MTEIITWKPAAYFDGNVYSDLQAAQLAALRKLCGVESPDENAVLIGIVTNSSDVIAILQASPNAPKRIGRPKGSKTRKPATEPQTEEKNDR